MKLYVYPELDGESDTLTTADDIELVDGLDGLYRYAAEHGFVETLQGFERDNLHIQSDDVLHRIRAGDFSWEQMVPAKAAEVIRRKRLLGCR